MGKTITSAQLEIYREDFGRFASDASGLVEGDSIRALAEFQYEGPLTDADFADWLKYTDVNGDSKVDIEEYLTLLLDPGWVVEASAAEESAPAAEESAPAAEESAAADAPSCEKLAEFLEKAAVAIEAGGGADAMRNAMEEMGLTPEMMQSCLNDAATQLKAGYEDAQPMLDRYWKGAKAQKAAEKLKKQQEAEKDIPLAHMRIAEQLNARAKRVFDIIDADKDGKLSVPELEAFFLPMAYTRVAMEMYGSCQSSLRPDVWKPPTQEEMEEKSKEIQAQLAAGFLETADTLDADANHDGMLEFDEVLALPVWGFPGGEEFDDHDFGMKQHFKTVGAKYDELIAGCKPEECRTWEQLLEAVDGVIDLFEEEGSIPFMRALEGRRSIELEFFQMVAMPISHGCADDDY